MILPLISRLLKSTKHNSDPLRNIISTDTSIDQEAMLKRLISNTAYTAAVRNQATTGLILNFKPLSSDLEKSSIALANSLQKKYGKK